MLFGFESVDAPVLESEELFVRKAGEEITEQLFNFEVRTSRSEVSATPFCPFVPVAHAWRHPCFHLVVLFHQGVARLQLLQCPHCLQDKGGRRMALRPEFTPSLARMVMAKGNALPLPAKWWTIAQCWRFERRSGALSWNARCH